MTGGEFRFPQLSVKWKPQDDPFTFTETTLSRAVSPPPSGPAGLGGFGGDELSVGPGALRSHRRAAWLTARRFAGTPSCPLLTPTPAISSRCFSPDGQVTRPSPPGRSWPLRSFLGLHLSPAIAARPTYPVVPILGGIESNLSIISPAYFPHRCECISPCITYFMPLFPALTMAHSPTDPRRTGSTPS